MKVMLVEDDVTMVSLLTLLMEIEGFSVVKAPEPDADKIIDTILREKPSLVMMDVNLAHLNGLDLLRKVRQNEELREVRILMASGMDFRRECLEAGADDFILKPYMPDELLQKIHQLVRH